MRKKIVRRQPLAAHDTTLVHLSPLLRRIYAARAIQSETDLDRSLQALLPYQTLLGMDHAVALLANAVMHQQTILIVGDFDADGATSTAVAMRALKSFGAKSVFYLVPHRLNDGYGLTPELVERAKTFAPHLIVTVDNGIAHHAGVLAAQALGIKVIITDHHLAGESLPPADAIVNPNQPNDPFASKCLAGVGVIFYVMLALCRQLQDHHWFEKCNQAPPKMSSLLDLVALGTVADLVPLDHNNRILVYQGLGRIRKGQCVPGIVALLECADRSFTRAQAADLGFAVAARLNAAGRLEDISIGIECLLCDDPVRARALAQQLNQLNNDRRVIEKEMHLQALAIMEHYPVATNKPLPKGLVLFDEAWHLGVVGILASRMKDHFHRPVIAFAPTPQGELRGSARSISSLHIRDALAVVHAMHPEWQMKFGGHAMAAGVTIKREQLPAFTIAFNEAVSQQIDEVALEPILLSDGALTAEELTLSVAEALREAGPWGQAFPEPLFDDVFQVIEQRLVGDKHLKLKLSKNNQMIDAIAFFVDTNCWPNHRLENIYAAFRLDVNEYQERRSVQLIIDYLEPA